MPRKKGTTIQKGAVTLPVVAKTRTIDSFSAMAEELKLSESYKSLLLGIVVVLLVAVLVGGFVKNRNTQNIQTTKETTAKKVEKKAPILASYTIVEGDDMKKISIAFYQSPDMYMLIAQTNGMTNPDIIEVGTKLDIPKIEKTQILAPSLARPLNEEPITTDSYTVGEGDVLWDIAVRSYKDGYKWKNIATANNLPSSDAIFAGMILQIPR